MNQDQLASIASRLAEIAIDIETQLNKSKVTLKEKYFLGLIRRQATLLKDIGHILSTNNVMFQTSTFILFRCLLDDFITVLYFESRGYQEADILSHTAKALDNKFKMLKDSKTINVKFFEDKLDGLSTEKHYQEEFDNFCDYTGL